MTRPSSLFSLRMAAVEGRRRFVLQPRLVRHFELEVEAISGRSRTRASAAISGCVPASPPRHAGSASPPGPRDCGQALPRSSIVEQGRLERAGSGHLRRAGCASHGGGTDARRGKQPIPKARSLRHLRGKPAEVGGVAGIFPRPGPCVGGTIRPGFGRDVRAPGRDHPGLVVALLDLGAEEPAFFGGRSRRWSHS